MDLKSQTIKLKTGNLFSPVERSDDEFIEVLMSGISHVERNNAKAALSRGFRVERIISDGHVSPPDFWYDQDESEFAAVLKGNAKLEFEHYILELNAGDWVIIPAHEKHRVIYTSSPCIWLAIFSPEYKSGENFFCAIKYQL